VDTVLLFVVYVLMSVVIQPSWLPNPIKLIIIIIIIIINLSIHYAECIVYGKIVTILQG